MAICAKFNLYMASMCIEFLNVSIQPVCRYTQCQNLMFRYSAESGYRICRILNIAYNGKRPDAAIQTITNALPRRALNGQKRTSDE